MMNNSHHQISSRKRPWAASEQNWPQSGATNHHRVDIAALTLPCSPYKRHARHSISSAQSSNGNTSSHGMLVILSTLELIQSLRFQYAHDPVELLNRILYIMFEMEPFHVIRLSCSNALRQALPLMVEPKFRIRAVTAILNLMEHHLPVLSLQLEACKILQRLIRPEDSVEENEDASEQWQRAIQIVVSSLELHVADANLQGLGLELIRRLKSCVSERMDWKTVCRVLLKSTAIHAAHGPIQRVALSVLAWLAEDEACRQIIIDHHGALVIPTVLKLHMSDALVQCNGAATLCWLIHAGGANGERIQLDPMHVETILSVLLSYMDNSSVFGNCVCVLCGVTALPDEAATVSAIRLGMEYHMESAKVQESCLRWLRFRPVQECVDEFRKCLPILLQAMECHPNDAHLQAIACDVLAALVDDSVLRKAILEDGAVDAVIRSLTLHKFDRRVQQGSVWFLSSVAQYAAPEPTTQAFGGGLSVLETIWTGLGIEGNNEVTAPDADNS